MELAASGFQRCHQDVLEQYSSAQQHSLVDDSLAESESAEAVTSSIESAQQAASSVDAADDSAQHGSEGADSQLQRASSDGHQLAVSELQLDERSASGQSAAAASEPGSDRFLEPEAHADSSRNSREASGSGAECGGETGQQEGLSQGSAVRQKLVAERRSLQKHRAQARAAKGARKAASRKGRKAVAAAMM